MGFGNFVRFLVLTAWIVSPLQSATQSVRWTAKDDTNAELSHILTQIKAKTGVQISEKDLLKIEDRDLATSHFVMLNQTAQGIPVHGNSIRIWTALESGKLIQLEAKVGDASRSQLVRSALTERDTASLVRGYIKSHAEDKIATEIRSTDRWENDVAVRHVRVTGRRGHHVLTLSLTTGAVTDYQYEEFPQHGGDAIDLEVSVYPIYEEDEETGKIYERVSSFIKGISPTIARPNSNPFESLGGTRYLETKYDPILGLTEEGRKQGFWAMSFIKGLAADIAGHLPQTPNTFENGLVLDGKYTTINFHPEVPEVFKNLPFKPAISAQFRPDWRPTPEDPDAWEMIPSSTLRGKPLMTADEALNRPARRDPNHDPVVYIGDGFDEIQVYWAVTRMFQALHPMGFTDPELSTRKFHAFLYDPDISMRDNAYYTDDTINFTTYSPHSGNMARDNTTIWHELGHGVMDRLMGDSIQLADTGGLSEGMADFVAQLVANDVTNTQPFEGKEKMRIINHTGFNLTNEVHDDGEAYGGSMNDLLEASIKKYGREGLTKVTDLTLETMRLTRDYPGLTANGWFDHMIFADELGHGNIRKGGELKPLIIDALNGRNFNLEGSTIASYSLKNGQDEVLAGTPGSRQRPIPITLKPTETATYNLAVALKDGTNYSFHYPVQVKVVLRGGPLQGALRWKDEDTQPMLHTLNSEADVAHINLTATGVCDEVNRPDGSCVDFAYIQIFNNQDTAKPVAKKRFYLRLIPKAP